MKKQNKKKRSFHVYFIFFAALVVAISSTLPSIVYSIIRFLYQRPIAVPQFIIISSIGLLSGIILSIFTGKILLSPIKKLQSSMEEVAGGNFDVKIEEESTFEEVAEMYTNFNLMVKELKSTETIQSDFISNASHEFKTPLSAIEGYATLLSDEQISDDERKLYTNKILFNISRMSHLVNNILLLSKVDNHSISKQNSTFLLDEQIRQAILYLETKWTEKNIEFDIDFDSIKYYGSEQLMFHVWTNLIGNAIKYSSVNDTVKISLKKSNSIVFTVEDNGPGISEEDKKHIFNKFFQGDTSHKEEGYGLGLALVKKIVDLHCGKVKIEDVNPKGTRFIVTLPGGIINKN